MGPTRIFESNTWSCTAPSTRAVNICTTECPQSNSGTELPTNSRSCFILETPTEPHLEMPFPKPQWTRGWLVWALAHDSHCVQPRRKTWLHSEGIFPFFNLTMLSGIPSLEPAGSGLCALRARPGREEPPWPQESRTHITKLPLKPQCGAEIWGWTYTHRLLCQLWGEGTGRKRVRAQCQGAAAISRSNGDGGRWWRLVRPWGDSTRWGGNGERFPERTRDKVGSFTWGCQGDRENTEGWRGWGCGTLRGARTWGWVWDCVSSWALRMLSGHFRLRHKDLALIILFLHLFNLNSPGVCSFQPLPF